MAWRHDNPFFRKKSIDNQQRKKLQEKRSSVYLGVEGNDNRHITYGQLSNRRRTT